MIFISLGSDDIKRTLICLLNERFIIFTATLAGIEFRLDWVCWYGNKWKMSVLLYIVWMDQYVQSNGKLIQYELIAVYLDLIGYFADLLNDGMCSAEAKMMGFIKRIFGQNYMWDPGL